MTPDSAVSLQSRFRGVLLGLAGGDAVGTALEFKPAGTFEPIDDMVGGGPFGLEAGQWTDDPSLALCLAESIVETERFDPVDQLERYCRWWREGHLSATERSAGNGSIMRLAPVPLAWHHDPETAIHLAGESSRTTHQHPAAIDGCRYLAALIVGALQGRPKSELLSNRFSPVPDLWDREPLVSEIDAIARGSFRHKGPPDIRGTGYVVRSLEAALWAFHRAEDFRTGCLLAANLGDDADTTAAVYGQIAGAYWGEPIACWSSRRRIRDAYIGATFTNFTKLTYDVGYSFRLAW
jgi:ADP-ribosylglycohydrolase